VVTGSEATAGVVGGTLGSTPRLLFAQIDGGCKGGGGFRGDVAVAACC
jgi:hypothetical protein